VVNKDIHRVSSARIPGTDGVTGRVLSMAVNRDGNKLAYSIATKVDPSYPTECSAYEVRVLDLQTGETRTWTGDDATPTNLTWAPDDRHLIMHVAACCGDYNPGVFLLDTRSAQRTFLDLEATPHTDDVRGCGISVTESHLRVVYAGQECYEESAVHVVELDPVTGEALRVGDLTFRGLQSPLVRSLSVVGDGAHALLSVDGGNYRIDNGVISVLPTHLDEIVW
jgi:hypothetical protein